MPHRPILSSQQDETGKDRMHADELRQAVTKIVDLLKRSDIRAVLDRYRASRGDDRTVAAARLGHAGAMIMDRLQSLSPAERRVARLMRLEELGTTEYWDALLGGASDPGAHQGEIVRLASRVMFASGQLPALVGLLEEVRAPTPAERYPIANGEGRLVIRLADAGERASNPDRIARSIDGVDMLYSACASIAKKPAMDLRLDGIDGALQRDLHFTGERDSLSAVIAVIESIPGALADVDPEGDIDLEAVIGTLPVFDDLEKLASLGSFSTRDLKDIAETMHQGALLVLESGVVLVDEPSPGAAGASTGRAARPVADSGTAGDAAGESADGDEHYERYLREREAMQHPATNGAEDKTAEQRRDAVDELLRSLDQSRNGG